MAARTEDVIAGFPAWRIDGEHTVELFEEVNFCIPIARINGELFLQMEEDELSDYLDGLDVGD